MLSDKTALNQHYVLMSLGWVLVKVQNFSFGSPDGEVLEDLLYSVKFQSRYPSIYSTTFIKHMQLRVALKEIILHAKLDQFIKLGTFNLKPASN